jgi:hypothetical protein
MNSETYVPREAVKYLRSSTSTLATPDETGAAFVHIGRAFYHRKNDIET